MHHVILFFYTEQDPSKKVYEATIDEMMKRIKSGKVQLKPVETQVGSK